MPELRIDPEFRDKIPPLTAAEFKQLEENIVSDGEVREPIITWNGTIIDGHHRWQVIQKHPEIPYKVKEMEFADKWAAIVWMCQNQIGRRNLTDEQKTYLIGKEYEASEFNERRFTALLSKTGVNAVIRAAEVMVDMPTATRYAIAMANIYNKRLRSENELNISKLC